MLNHEGTRESKNTRLTHEISECKDKIAERERERERERESKNLTICWNCFLGMGSLAILTVFLAIKENKAWWGGFIITTLFAFIGLYGIISIGSKLNNIKQEIKRLKKQEKELKTQLRW